jgi:hypothetical protein
MEDPDQFVRGLSIRLRKLSCTCTHTDCDMLDGSGAACVLCSSATGSCVKVPFVCAVVGVRLACVSVGSRTGETALDKASVLPARVPTSSVHASDAKQHGSFSPCVAASVL